SKGIRIVRLVAEQTRGLHSRDELRGGSIVVPLAFGDLERERESERVDHHVDLRGEAAARPTYALLRGPPFPPRSSPTADHRVEVEPSCTPMEHSSSAMDSACRVHSNFRPPQNPHSPSPSTPLSSRRA